MQIVNKLCNYGRPIIQKKINKTIEERRRDYNMLYNSQDQKEKVLRTKTIQRLRVLQLIDNKPNDKTNAYLIGLSNQSRYNRAIILNGLLANAAEIPTSKLIVAVNLFDEFQWSLAESSFHLDDNYCDFADLHLTAIVSLALAGENCSTLPRNTVYRLLNPLRASYKPEQIHIKQEHLRIFFDGRSTSPGSEMIIHLSSILFHRMYATVKDLTA